MVENLILLKSLKYINDCVVEENISTTSYEFLKIHNRNILMLKELSTKNDYSFINKEIKKYPEISTTDIDFFLNKKKKEISLLRIAGGIIIDFLFNLLKNKGQTDNDIKNKMFEIVAINEKLHKLIENPYLAELGNG